MQPVRKEGNAGTSTKRKWLFRVRVPNLKKEEEVCVTGNVSELGSWQPEKCIPLEHKNDKSDIWSKVIFLPDKVTVYYRYCVCVIVDPGHQVIVRNWEAYLIPRDIQPTANSPSENDKPQNYGEYKNTKRVDTGWLINETVILLKFYDNPLTLWRVDYTNRKMTIRVNPVGLLHHNDNTNTRRKSISEVDSKETFESLQHGLIEVASLMGEESTFHPQSPFGEEYKQNDMLIFQSSVLFPQNVAFLIDLYIYSSRSQVGEPPYHVGTSYVLPTVLHPSEGSVISPVTSTKHQPQGQIRVEYVIIKPMPNFKCDLRVSYARYWKMAKASLDVGHRGSGCSFKTQNCAEVRENTVASFKYAIDHGADFVEFDVHLSKDLVPVVYHDFHVYISMKQKKHLDEHDMLELPVKELTLEQLHMLKVYHSTEAKAKTSRFFDDHLEDHQPFPTLQHILEVLSPHVGFNVEIKWTMQLLDGTYELHDPTDLNLFLDKILEVVLRHGRERKILFSCFHPDVCAAMRLKQNKYPVLFLSQGQSQHYDPYKDPRCWTIPNAVKCANILELLGVCVITEELMKDPSLVELTKKSGLVIFCWGDDNANSANIKFLKQLGLDGIIYDKMYQFSCKDVKESMFLMKARKSVQDLIVLAAAAVAETPQMSPRVSVIKEQGFDIDKARQYVEDTVSTATSLGSL